MKLPEILERYPTGDVAAIGERVYGAPYQTPDGATIITVGRVRAGAVGVTAAPAGVFVIRGDDAKWVPAVDANRVAVIGVSTGLLAAVITCLAVLRRPPWPDLRRDR